MLPLLLAAALARLPDPAGADFFEKHVRPVLVEQCQGCHGPDKQKGGIRLDQLKHLLADTDGTGPVVRPRDLKTSRLIPAIDRTGEHPMPPEKKLSDAQIAALKRWVEMGAPWPAAAQAASVDQRSRHWAFQPLAGPPVPAGPDHLGAIDRFLAERLAKAGLAFSPRADKAVWLKRVSYDLTGLPPTEAERDAFLKDDSPDAAAKVVDRLLASPGYGERWGRYWLDVARYADTREGGSQIDIRYPFAYSYRDWVIAAFNADLPFDRFVVLQLAADQLKLSGRPPRPGGARAADRGQTLQRLQVPQRPRPDRRPHRRDRPRADGAVGELRPLPRSQVRSRPDGRLLLALRHPRRPEAGRKAPLRRCRPAPEIGELSGRDDPPGPRPGRTFASSSTSSTSARPSMPKATPTR